MHQQGRNNPIWTDIHLVHQIRLTGAVGQKNAKGMLSKALLESALNKPKQLWHYAEKPPHLAELAASYAYGIAMNHPFTDGNKRTALIVMTTFLERNGYILVAGYAEIFETMIRLVIGEISEKEFAEWLEKNLQPSGEEVLNT